MTKKATSKVDRTCTIKSLPKSKWDNAAKVAVETNPANAPLIQLATGIVAPKRSELVVLTQKYWGSKGVNLGVAFLDITKAELKNKILQFMNLWGKEGANIKFREASKGVAEIRIATDPDGYWSYLGTDVLLVGKNEATMNLDSFSLSTSDGEYHRVVTHETGHTLGFPHEHLRKELVAELDPAKTISYFKRTYGWSESMTRHNVLTPLDDDSIRGSTTADDDSVMCYQLPASITRSGRPIRGGDDINALDYKTVSELYPGSIAPPPGSKRLILEYEGDAKNFKVVEK